MDFKIQNVPEADIGQAIELFKICFDSDNTEAELFFAPKQKTIIGAYAEDQLCSMLTVFNCKAVVGNRIIPTAYMAGVATAPDFRGNKLFSKCFDYFLNCRHGFELVFCIPASETLFNLYNSVEMTGRLFVKKVKLAFDSEPTQNSSIKILHYGDNLSEYCVKTMGHYKRSGRFFIEKSDELCLSTINTYLYFGGMAAIGDNFTALFRYENGRIIVADIAVNGGKTEIENAIRLISRGKETLVTIPDTKQPIFDGERRLPIAAYKKLNSEINLDGLYANVLYNEM